MVKDKSKIVFVSDMDGTLLSADKTLSKRNADAIARLREAGGIFAVATGRVLQATEHYFKPFGLECPVILCNGGMIYDCGEKKVLFAEYLDSQRARATVAELLEKFPEVCAEICTPDQIYDVQINEQEKYHWKIGGFTAKVCGSLDEVPEEKWCKILFAMPEEIMPAFAECAAAHSDEAEFFSSNPVFFEMLPKGCTKGTALEKLIKALGREDAYTVAMGDFNNDIQMLQYADLAACPSNAIDEVKAICDLVCSSDCTQGAVAEAIDYILR